MIDALSKILDWGSIFNWSDTRNRNLDTNKEDDYMSDDYKDDNEIINDMINEMIENKEYEVESFCMKRITYKNLIIDIEITEDKKYVYGATIQKGRVIHNYDRTNAKKLAKAFELI